MRLRHSRLNYLTLISLLMYILVTVWVKLSKKTVNAFSERVPGIVVFDREKIDFRGTADIFQTTV